METRDFDSYLLDVFHELQTSYIDEIIEAISKKPKVSRILNNFQINFKDHKKFTEWCKVISENLDEMDLKKLIKMIQLQEKEYNLDVFREF